MGLLTGLQPTATSSRNRCGVANVIVNLDDAEDVEALRAMLADTETWSHTDLARKVSEALDVKLSARVVSIHRKGDCSCRS